MEEALAEAWRPEPVESPGAQKLREGGVGTVRGRAARRGGSGVHSLCIAGGPGQPPGLLENEDGAGDVVCAALHLILRQPEELRPAVREAQRQVRATAAAAAVLGAGAASHDAAHEIGHGRFHPSEHITPAPGSRWVSRRRRPAEAQRGACRLRRARGARGASRATGARGSLSSVLQGGEPRPPVLPVAAAATSPGDTSATGRHGAGGRLGRASESPGSGGRAAAAAGPFPAPCAPLLRARN